jgi:cytochrome b subunit of formate dehydrogenase
LSHSSFANEPFLTIAGLVLYGSVLLYPVISYYLLRVSQVAWILSFVSSLATMSLHIYFMSTSLVTILVPMWSLFGIMMNCLILYLLYTCRTEFSIGHADSV